uniref:Hpc2-related domain-containing protein n=1 Tax=Glossina brevipalpis TaxID=37001 RepID=A0A1A9W7D3_9MUSC
MTDPKRVTLNTISNTVSSTIPTAASSSSSKLGADLLAPPEKPTNNNKSNTKTSVRLKIELFQTDSSKYPEFNYAKLMHLEKKKLKKLKQKTNGFTDPFEENDDDVIRIAKELERKYGSTYGSGRSKNKRGDYDIGMGYDESDSFIDNTEAYDEIIPDEVETIEGGFYINCGALEFKKLHTESLTTKTDEIIKMPNRPKKRVISSSSEDSSSSGEDEDRDDESDDEDEETAEESSVETTKTKSSSEPAEKRKKTSAQTNNSSKKRPICAENSVTKKTIKDKITPSGLSGSSSNSPKPQTDDLASDSEKERVIKKVEKTTTVKDMLKAQRDNFLKSQHTSDSKSSSNGETKVKSSEDDDDDEDESSSEDSEDDDTDDNSDSNQSGSNQQKPKKTIGNEETAATEKLRTSDTKLPDIDSEILKSIYEFRDSSKAKNLIGKKFQFDDKLTEDFLKIDDSLLCLDKTQRSMVFSHLEFQLSLPKYYFLRKAKQLRIKEEKMKSKRVFYKLQKAVTEVMPAVLASYDAELRKYAELQSANINSDQPPKMPKKKFPWNNHLRNLLYDVYEVRWTSYPVLKASKENLEEFLTSYMRQKVVQIWPNGWVRYEDLQREIEKKKIADKKAKEKKKLATAPLAGASAIPIVSASAITVPNLALQAAVNANLTPPQVGPNAYMKQFEEFATRSNANSDTDSVASSSTSSGLKRKYVETSSSVSNKQSKSRPTKINGEQAKVNVTGKQLPQVTVELVSPSKRADYSVNHLVNPVALAAAALIPVSNSSSNATSIFSATKAAPSQPLKHSSATHIIDLDNYMNKQLQVAAIVAASSTMPMLNSRRESSGDSEIEFVGVYPAKSQTKQRLGRSNSRSNTPNNSHHTGEAIKISSNATSNNGGTRNAKAAKIHQSPTTSTLCLNNFVGMDVNKLNTIIEMDKELQLKQNLPTVPNNQQSQPGTVPPNLQPK